MLYMRMRPHTVPCQYIHMCAMCMWVGHVEQVSEISYHVCCRGPAALSSSRSTILPCSPLCIARHPCVSVHVKHEFISVHVVANWHSWAWPTRTHLHCKDRSLIEPDTNVLGNKVVHCAGCIVLYTTNAWREYSTLAKDSNKGMLQFYYVSSRETAT